MNLLQDTKKVITPKTYKETTHRKLKNRNL